MHLVTKLGDIASLPLKFKQRQRARHTPVQVYAVVLVEHEGQVGCGRDVHAVRPPEAAAGQTQQLARGGHAPHHEAVGLRSFGNETSTVVSVADMCMHR